MSDVDLGWTAPISDEEFDYFREVAHREAGIWIADFKRNMVFRRISKRVRATGFKSIDAYRNYLADGQNWITERQNLINALTTNKTSFYREEHHFDYLRNTALPALEKSAGRGTNRLRIWSAGCSSGEEAYTIAITLRETMEQIGNWDARILATDIDTEMVEAGQRGLYLNEFRDDIPGPLQSRYSVRAGDDRFQMSQALRNLITFKPLNLLGPWPMKGPFDMIFCRNVVIYFDKPTKKALFDRFADILKPDGLLFIGHSESLFKVSGRFRMVGQSVYQRIE